MRQRLVIGISANGINLEHVRLFNINVTNQQGNTINPTPIRSSFAGGAPSASTNLSAPTAFFLVWPNELPGDVIPTVTVSAVYTPPAPGAPWASDTLYPAGSVVVPPLNGNSSNLNGHYYTALKGGLSNDAMPFAAGAGWPEYIPTPFPELISTTLSWNDVGPGTAGPPPAPPAAAPQCVAAKPWQPSTYYPAGSCVQPANSANKNYYVAGAAGVSQTGAGPFPTMPGGPAIPEPATTLTWLDAGTTAPSTTVKRWLASTAYSIGDAIIDPANGHYYLAVQPGVSAATPPTFPNPSMDVSTEQAIPSFMDGGVTWQYAAAAPPDWQPMHLYYPGAVIRPNTFHFYKAVQAAPATSGCC